MWKKIGAIGPTSNDNKSNRSRDENFHDQPFSQVTKARMSQTQMFYQANDYFFPNFIQKVKEPQLSKCGSQQNMNMNFNKLQHARSCKNISSEYMTSGKTRKTLNQYEIQELNKKLNHNILKQTGEYGHKNTNAQKGQQQNMSTLSTEKISSSTSIDGELKKLKSCKSTPQINLVRINSITQQIPLDKKIQAKNNIQKLKKQHKEVKKTLQTKLSDFSQDFKTMQDQIKYQLSRVIDEKQKKNNTLLTSRNSNQGIKMKNLNLQQFVQQTKKFGDKFKTINQKKAQLLEKYKSLRVK